MVYLGNPNGAKQLWSKWTFDIREMGRHVPRVAVQFNVSHWLCKGFGSAGRVRVLPAINGWRIECLIEGPPAHDPGYVASVRREFQTFVDKGWGPLSVGTLAEVKVMAGDMEDGKPRRQMIEMPPLLAR